MQSSSGQKIAYDLYQDPGHAIAWGTGSAAKHDNRSSAVETVYGRAPPQAAPVGSYSDTIVVTVTYAGSN
jgi:spore coat protein U-like protein